MPHARNRARQQAGVDRRAHGRPVIREIHRGKSTEDRNGRSECYDSPAIDIL
jgi:hypothetical protein